jgi:hypothetical protein
MTTQYLDDSDVDPINWECQPCPNGGFCEGERTWKEVVAKFGYFRVRDKSNTPPGCLFDEENKDRAEPLCAFSKCLNPPACLGAPNDEFKGFFFEKGTGMDLSQVGRFDSSNKTNTDNIDTDTDTVYIESEQCDEANGYLNGGVCNHSLPGTNASGISTTRCRLCATCKVGYNRISMSSTRCKQCPSATTNKIFLAAGFFVMILGSIALIVLTIQSEGGSDATSDAIKKIILNFLQIASLAGGLPLQWPDEVTTMFSTMATMASAGSTLLIPDCELTEMKTAEAFYLKQAGFTFLVPIIIMICLVGWFFVWTCCGTRLKITKARLKDYVILTLVLMLFLCYPMLVRLSLSSLQCPYVNGKAYLMADLEERCFTGRHTTYLILLTMPQLILYVFGLPIIAGTILLREPKRRLWHSFSFRMRYGLLFMGYRRERFWWELVIVVRKVTIVAIGTFGTLMGRVDLQAYVAILVVFISIVVHLVGKPFDTHKQDTKLLYVLEFMGLSVCWGTFWAGLLFYLGPHVVPKWGQQFMTMMIWATNTGYLLFALKCYIHEYYRDEMKKRKSRRSTVGNMRGVKNVAKKLKESTGLKQWRVHPIPSQEDAELEKQFALEDSKSEEGTVLAPSTAVQIGSEPALKKKKKAMVRTGTIHFGDSDEE